MTKTKFEPGLAFNNEIETAFKHGRFEHCEKHERRIVIAFASEVNQRAEAAIIKGGPMTGAHMRAILEVLEEYEK